eukprot:COSAG06_NODE_2562_length_6663_cov_2.216941_4_plen_169_part_00
MPESVWPCMVFAAADRCRASSMPYTASVRFSSRTNPITISAYGPSFVWSSACVMRGPVVFVDEWPLQVNPRPEMQILHRAESRRRRPASCLYLRRGRSVSKHSTRSRPPALCLVMIQCSSMHCWLRFSRAATQEASSRTRAFTPKTHCKSSSGLTSILTNRRSKAAQG